MGSEAKLSVASRTFLIVPSWYWQQKKKYGIVKAVSTLLLTEKTPVHPRGCPSLQFCSEFQFYLQNLTHTKLPVKESARIEGPWMWSVEVIWSALSFNSGRTTQGDSPEVWLKWFFHEDTHLPTEGGSPTNRHLVVTFPKAFLNTCLFSTPQYSQQQQLDKCVHWKTPDGRRMQCHTQLCSSSHQSKGRCLPTLLVPTHTSSLSHYQSCRWTGFSLFGLISHR